MFLLDDTRYVPSKASLVYAEKSTYGQPSSLHLSCSVNA